MNNTKTEIQIYSDSITNTTIIDCLESCLGDLLYDTRSEYIKLGLEMDPAVLVATVSAISSTCTALISGLLQLLKENRPKGSIKITFKDGRAIEVPAGTSMKEIRKLASLASKTDCFIENIQILSNE